jgi:altronate dehydratase large subunit
MIIKQGGTTILSETTELIGAEHLVAKRSATPHVKKRIYEIVRRMQKKIETMGVDSIGGQPTPGNLRGGITTIEEKSLGCVHKAGNAQIQEVLEYGEKPRKIAGGAQLIAFTTGLGTPVGSAIAPVLKITGNPRTYRTMKEDMDINAGTIIEGKETIECVGIKIYDEIIRVASGKRTKAERHGYHEFAINRIGPSL